MPSKLVPPGPDGHLLSGNLSEFTQDALGFLSRCAREYGDVVRARFVNVPVYLLNHPDHIEYVLAKNSCNFAKGRGGRGRRLAFGNGLLTSEGDSWLRHRRLAQPAFHRDRIAAYADVMVAYAERMLASWQDEDVRDLHRDMMRLSLEIAAKTLFDAEVSGEVEDIGAALNTLIEQFLVLTPLSILIPDFIPTPSNLRIQRAVRRLDETIYRIIRERRAAVHDAPDLLSMLAHARDEDGSQMTDRQLRDEAMTLLLTGHETIAIALSWTAYLLSQHHEVEAKLMAELRQVLGVRSPGFLDVPRLPYTQRVVMESMRLYPPVYAFGRQALKTCEIGGYEVPAGALVFVSQWVMHREPRYFSEPEVFDPDRWAGDRAKRLPRFSYFPFGAGPRQCIGESFAMMEVVLVLATILQRFRLRLLPGHLVVPMPSITLRPKHGIKMALSLRH